MKYYFTAVELLAYATVNGLSVADFYKLSLGFVIDFCIINNKIQRKEDLHREEKNYNKMKSVIPIVEQDFHSGKISEKRYVEFIEKYNRLEDKYGFHY